jgi:Flp pilus assembly pilin Flp
MLNAFIKDESGAVAIAVTYGVFALGLTAAIVSMAGMAGSVLDHSYSAIPYDAMDRAPAIEGFTEIAGQIDGSYLREVFGRLLGGS